MKGKAMSRSAVVVWDDESRSWTYEVRVRADDGQTVPVRSGSLAGNFGPGSDPDEVYLAFIAQVGFLSAVDIMDPKLLVSGGMLASH